MNNRKYSRPGERYFFYVIRNKTNHKLYVDVMNVMYDIGFENASIFYDLQTALVYCPEGYEVVSMVAREVGIVNVNSIAGQLILNKIEEEKKDIWIGGNHAAKIK